MPDSYDLLAESIERVIRRDLPPPASARQLAGSIDRIMSEEARAGELRLAQLRVLVVAPFVALAIDALVRRDVADPRPVAAASATVATVVAAVWMTLAIGLALALRRGWYRRWVPRVMPGVDALMIAVVFLAPLYAGGHVSRAPAPEALAGLTALCAFLAISGGVRLSRSSARIGTALAVAVFVVAAAAARLGLLPALAILVALVGAGLLSASITGLVRRLVIDEVAKATLSQMYDEASREVDAREQVLKIVSHDLRNPLHTVGMGASLLMEVQMPHEKQREHLARIKRAGERMERLVHDLLDVAKLEAGRVAIAPRELDAEPLLREAHDMLSPLAAEHSLTLELDVAERLPRVSADAGRVLQVISNLVGNAVKFTSAGGRIVIRAQPSPGGVHFSVSDTGCGIPPEQLERIFGRFWQADAADRRGIGLGLSIAKGIVAAHGGRIWVESRVGEGTTFHFVLGSVLAAVPALPSFDRRRSEARQ